MKFSLKSLTFVGLVAAAAIVLAADGTTLKFAPKEGAIHKYKMSAVFDAGGTSANVTGDVSEKILKIDATSGDITIERSQGALTVDVGGQTIPVDAAAPTVHVYHPDGSLVEIRGEGLNPATYRLSVLSSFRYPKDPVSEGSTWKVEIPADAKTGVVKTVGEYKVVGMEKLMGLDTLKISTSVKELEGDTPASSEGMAWISTADGTLVKFDGTWTNAPVAPAPMPVSGKYTLTLVP